MLPMIQENFIECQLAQSIRSPYRQIFFLALKFLRFSGLYNQFRSEQPRSRIITVIELIDHLIETCLLPSVAVG